MSEDKIIKSSNVDATNQSPSIKVFDFIIGGSILVIFFLIPLFFTGKVAQGLGFEKLILFYFLVLLGVVAWATKGVIKGELSLIRTPLDIPILSTVALFGLSSIFSISTKDSLIGSYGSSSKGFIAVLVFVLFYYLLVNNLNKQRIKMIFLAIISSGAVLSVFSFLQLKGKYLLSSAFTHSQGFNSLGSLSGLTMYLVVIFPLLVIGASQVKEILPNAKKGLLIGLKIFFSVSIIFSLLVLMYLNGFTFWPVPVIGMVIILMFFMAKIVKISNNNLVVPLLSFLILIIFLVMGNFQIGNLDLPAEVSLSRGASWDIAKNAVKENPVFGSGPSTFYYSFSKFKDINFNASPLWNVRFDSATGSIFELLSTVGVLGAISVIVIVLISISTLFLTLLKSKERGLNSILLGLFSSFISLVILSVLFPQNNSIILLSVMITIFAVTTSIVMYPEKFKNLKLSFRASAKYALALAAIFLSVSSGVVVMFTMGLKMYMADTYAKDALAANTPELKIEKINQAIKLAPYQDSYYLSSANNFMALANKSAVNGNDQAQVGANLSQAIEQGKKALELSPNKAGNNESLALIYENASFYTRGALEWAEDLYNKVGELDPQNPTSYLRNALVNMARANVETDEEEKRYYIGEAIKKYDEAIEKKADLAAAYYGKGIASEKLNNIDDAIEQLKNANLVSKNNLDYRFELGRLYFNRGVSSSNISQSDSKKIAENDIAGKDGGEDLSVSDQGTGDVINRNADLNTAEQLFLSILLPVKQGGNPKHANARYSLAVLYQKIGEKEKTKTMVDSLINILQDQNTINAVKGQFKGLY